MNNRIRELAEQAGLKHHNWITNESNVKDGDFKYPRLEDYEKFAQLIVAECADIANKQFSVATGLDDRDCWTAAEMKKHFGVEQ